MYYIIISLLFLVGCGSNHVETKQPTKSQKEILLEIREEARSVQNPHTFVEDCDFGVVGGELCFSGNDWACGETAKIQDSTGKLWRNQFQCGADTNETDFSRDQLMGWLMYLIRTQDHRRGNLTTDYINRIGSLCEQREYNRCELTPSTIHVYNLVAKHVGFRKLDYVSTDPFDVVLWLSAETVPLGYQMHLVAMKILMLREMGYSSVGIKNASLTLHKRQPDNPLFAYVAGEDGGSRLISFWENVYKPKASVCYYESGWFFSKERAEWCQRPRWGISGYDVEVLVNLLTRGY